MDASPIIDVLRAAVPGAVLVEGPAIDMPTVYVDRDHLIEVLLTLRDHPELQFALLVDLTATDRLPAEPRFEIVYHLACLGPAYPPGSVAPARRLRLKVSLAGDDVSIPTSTPVFPSANWTEREVFDLFGIDFQNHPDMRRILTPEDWTGHPLRKDYPVQLRKTPQSWSPVQVSAEEFAENIRGQRARAQRELRDAEPKRD
jgi:NADH-quinone oxidoreductase subunit C